MSFLRVEGEALTVELSLYGVYVSSGSACSSRVLEPSHVLLAIGRKHEEAHGSILFKVSHHHREDDIIYALEVIPKAVERLRNISAWR
jgi:cysteine desulfurase